MNTESLRTDTLIDRPGAPMHDPLFEPLLRRMRIARVLPVIKQYPNCVLLDVGCGFNHRFLSTVEPHIQEGVGVDFKVPELNRGKLRTIQTVLDARLPFDDGTFDVVTMLAVLEHLEKPLEIVREIERVLKPGGVLALTVPGKWAKPVLEFLALKLQVVNEAEIRDHKQYFDKPELTELFAQTGLSIETHQHFQLGMNNFCVARKPFRA